MYFWLGPLGDLRALPPIEHDQEPDVAAAAPVGEFVSLSGAITRDQYGPHRRTWNLSWPYLEAAQVDELDALRAGHLGWPLWLIDPQRPNKASRQVASTGSELASTTDWKVDAGTLAFRRLPAAQRPPGVHAAGVLEWTLEEGQAGFLSPARAHREQRVPVDPHGGPVSAASFVRRAPGSPSTLTTAAAVSVDTWDLDGTLVTTTGIGGAVGEAWLDLADLTQPLAGHVAYAVAVGASGPLTLQVAGVRYGHGETIPDPSVGGGAAIVVPREMPETYPGPGEITTSLQLAEA